MLRKIFSSFLVSLLLAAGVAAQTGSKPAATPRSAPAAAKSQQVVPIITFTSGGPKDGAFTLNYPKEWSITGEIVRHSGCDVQKVVRATSQKGQIRVFINDPKILPNEVPNRQTQFARLREGQTLPEPGGGQVRIARYQTGEQFAKSYISAARLCSSGTPQITRSGILQAASNELSMRAAPYGRAIGAAAQASVGEATFQCGSQTGYVQASILLARASTGMEMWFVFDLNGFVAADQAQEDLARYVLSNMVGSLKTNPQWEAREASNCSQMAKDAMHAQDQMTAAVVQRARQEAESNASSVANWEKNSNANLAAAANGEKNSNATLAAEDGYDRAIRGTTLVNDPLEGTREVSNTHDFNFRATDGTLGGNNTGDAPLPNEHGSWTALPAPH